VTSRSPRTISRSRTTARTRRKYADLRPGADSTKIQKKARNKRTRAKLPRDLKKQKIYFQPLGLWPKSLTSDEITLQIYQQADRQLEALIKHYKIPPHSPERLWLLSFYLARDMGLMEIAFGPPPRGRGRPRKWKNTEKGDIASKRISDRVDKRRSSKNSDVAILSKTRAAAHLIEQHPEYKNITSKSLVNRAGEAYKRKKQTPGVPCQLPWSILVGR
jgi:hypothetical protein